MFKGKSIETLEKELDALKKSGPHKEGSPEYTKEKELDFALRAKHGFGNVEESKEGKLKQYINEIINEVLNEEDKWIQKAIKHPGRCTPMSNPECTGHARALAKRFKSHELKEDGMMDESAFSRQHYNEIANIIRSAGTKQEIVSELADLFEADNPNFIRDKFLQAAGIKDITGTTY
jgi:hypothetical protein